jgi:phosphate-selective porin OprO/OprP
MWGAALILAVHLIAASTSAGEGPALSFALPTESVPVVLPPLIVPPRTPPKAGTEAKTGAPDSGPPSVAEEAKAAKSQTEESTQAQFTLREGLVGQTADKAFRFHVGGRFDWDNGWYRVPANIQQTLFPADISQATGAPPQLLDGTDFRRFRFTVDGTVWEQFEFKLEADLSRASDFTGFQTNPQTNIFLTHAWVALHDLPLVDTIRAGHQKELLTFSNASSANYQPFMERPYVFDAFENPFSFDSGISMNRTYFDQSVTSWLGAFWNGTRSQAFNVGSHYAVSGRLTWMPIDSEEEQRWLCFSLSGSLRSIHENDPNVAAARPLVRTGQSFDVPILIRTPALLSRDGLEVLGVGAQAAWGPLTLGGEWLCWNVPNTYTGSLPNPDGSLPTGALCAGDVFLSGFYLQALYFLTPGDHRPVNRILPSFERVRPVRNFWWQKADGWCGPGAWEVGVRYDHIDLNSGVVRGGTLDSLTVGLNWYLNPNTRVTTDYVYTLRDTGSPTSTGSFDAFGFRVHFDF